MLKGYFLMKIDCIETEEKAERALRQCLGRVPFLKVDSLLRGVRNGQLNRADIDLFATVSLPDRKQTLIAEVKTNGQPRFARDTVNLLLRQRELYPGSYGVFIAPYVSSQAAEICRADGIGYLDFTGNCFLCFGQVYIEQRGNPNTFNVKRDLRSLYSPRAERILRVLLNDPRRTWKMQELASEADVSLGQIANIKNLLADREWIESSGKGVALKEPEKLMTEWAENYSYRKNDIREFYSLKSLGEIEAEIARACAENNINYALTGFSGAARIAPFVKYQRVMVYTESRIEELLALLNLKKVTTGANVQLFIPYDEGVFYGAREIDAVRTVSPVQLYLDLINMKGRGEEAAQEILEKAIKPAW